MPVSRLTYKYQATIPRQVREVLALGAGDYVNFIVDAEGDVTVRKLQPQDSELQALEATLAPEWGSSEDDEAYENL